jgi:hypothetical protein
MRTIPVTVSETTAFRRTASVIMPPSEIESLIDHLARHPEAGNLIPGTGGVRKLRWWRAGIGKRGGTRVIYYYHDNTIPLLLLLAYAKSSASDITPDQRRRIADLVEDFVRTQKKRRRRP